MVKRLGAATGAGKFVTGSGSRKGRTECAGGGWSPPDGERECSVEDQNHHARVAALSMAHGAALAKLLRAHGRDEHATNIEAALRDFAEIISGQVGQHALDQALSWVAHHTWDDGGSLAPASAQKR